MSQCGPTAQGPIAGSHDNGPAHASRVRSCRQQRKKSIYAKTLVPGAINVPNLTATTSEAGVTIAR